MGCETDGLVHGCEIIVQGSTNLETPEPGPVDVTTRKGYTGLAPLLLSYLILPVTPAPGGLALEKAVSLISSPVSFSLSSLYVFEL